MENGASAEIAVTGNAALVCLDLLPFKVFHAIVGAIFAWDDLKT